jgi:hypothetical protein
MKIELYFFGETKDAAIWVFAQEKSKFSEIIIFLEGNQRVDCKLMISHAALCSDLGSDIKLVFCFWRGET